MADNDPATKYNRSGVAVALGLIAGIVLFAATGNAVWIAIGIVLGAAFSSLPRTGDRRSSD